MGDAHAEVLAFFDEMDGEKISPWRDYFDTAKGFR